MLIILTGCRKETEIRDRGFVQSVGIDTSGSSNTAGLSLFHTEEERTVLSGEGKTIFSALENAEASQELSLFTGHMELLVLSQGSFSEQLEIFLDNNRISPSCSLICVKEGAAEMVMENDGLKELLDSQDRKGYIVRKDLSSVLEDLMGNDGMAAVPVIKDGELTMGIIDNKKLIGTLSHEESMGLRWLSGGAEDFYLPLEIKGDPVDFYIRKSSTDISSKISGGEILITVEIKINGEPVSRDPGSEEIKNAAAARITEICGKTISKTVTAYGADVFGIEKSVLMKSPDASSLGWEGMKQHLSFKYVIKIAEF